MRRHRESPPTPWYVLVEEGETPPAPRYDSSEYFRQLWRETGGLYEESIDDVLSDVAGDGEPEVRRRVKKDPPIPYKKIGAALGVSAERARQIEWNVLEKFCHLRDQIPPRAPFVDQDPRIVARRLELVDAALEAERRERAAEEGRLVEEERGRERAAEERRAEERRRVLGLAPAAFLAKVRGWSALHGIVVDELGFNTYAQGRMWVVTAHREREEPHTIGFLVDRQTFSDAEAARLASRLATAAATRPAPPTDEWLAYVAGFSAWALWR